MSDQKACAMERCISFSSQAPQARLVLALFSAKRHTFTWGLALITNFKKVDVKNLKNATDVEDHS